MSSSTLFDISEKLLELGVSGAKKTVKPISYIAHATKEQITSKYNYTPLNSPDVVRRLQGNYDKGQLDQARNNIASHQAPNEQVQKVQERLSFFSKYKQETEQFNSSLKRKEQEEKRQEEEEKARKQQEEQKRRQAQIQQEEPQGRVRQSVLAPRKRRKSFETKANGGK